MSDRLKTNLALSAIVAFGCAVPVYFGAVESRPAVWKGEIVFARTGKQRPNRVHAGHRKVNHSAQESPVDAPTVKRSTAALLSKGMNLHDAFRALSVSHAMYESGSFHGATYLCQTPLFPDAILCLFFERTMEDDGDESPRDGRLGHWSLLEPKESAELLARQSLWGRIDDTWRRKEEELQLQTTPRPVLEGGR